MQIRSAHLFCALLSLMFVLPLVEPEKWSGLVFRGMLFLTLLLALHSVSQSRKSLALGLLLVGTSMVSSLLVTWGQRPEFIPVGMSSVAIFCGFLAYSKTLYTLRCQEVTSETLFSAITGYLVVAIGFTCLYQVMELMTPGSIQGRLHPTSVFPTASVHDMFYFSVATLTTAGYGDLAPCSIAARNLACFEMLFGTMYPTIILARLVGLHSSQK